MIESATAPVTDKIAKPVAAPAVQASATGAAAGQSSALKPASAATGIPLAMVPKSASSNKQPSGNSLPDLCAGLFVYVLWLRAQPADKAPDVRVVYQRFDELLRSIDADGQRGGATPENVRLVIFALVAFADEMILSSTLPFRSAWSDQPLQLTYFNENAAGEEFFTRLENARRKRDVAVDDVLESYYLCLSLGFKGRYGGSPKREKQRRTLMEQLVIDIRSARGDAAGLSPNAINALSLAPTFERFSVWLVPSLAFAALVVMAIVLCIIVSQLAANAAAAIA